MKDFYIVSYKPDGEGAPYFFDMDWVPELPSFHYPSANPELSSLSSRYRAIADIRELEADWLPDHFLASHEFLAVCDKLSCSYISCATDLFLKGEPSRKEYFFFVVSERLRAMDVERSSFTLDSNPKLKDISMPSYEVIDRLVILESIGAHLFYFEEIHEVVCSPKFLEACEAAKIFGLDFIKIDEEYRYAPWEDF